MHGIIVQFTHQSGQDEACAAFGRYSWREDGEARYVNNASAEAVV